ncbi:MAG: maleylpyruvate isomerase family mycothiol-dependent enzyme [Actinomycetota bacterium]
MNHVQQLEEAFSSFGRVVDSLTPEQWEAQSLCPAWTVQGVVQHVTTIEAGLLGWRPGGENPFAAMAAVGAEIAALSTADLAARYHATVQARLAELGQMSDDEFDAPSFTPVGQATYGRFMAIRVFDTWVHERDIRVPLGIAGDDAGAAAETSLDEVQGSIGYIAGKKIGVPDGKGIAFHVTGPVQRDILVKVDGRAARVAELADPDVEVWADSLTFMLLACGRIDPDQAVADGRIRATGEPELAARAMRNLAFTM